tara:strand:- start:85131 stop:85541 length:411 start_codon:yes stop_codon:yes gene_type:complete
MKIKYKKKRLYANLIIGCMWIGFGIFNLLEEEKTDWYDYGYLVMGILYIGNYLYDITNQYLTIENGTIKKSSIFKKKIYIDDITWIKKFAGDYTLKTDTKELKINTELIEKESLTELNKILGKLNLPAEKTPFTNC